MQTSRQAFSRGFTIVEILVAVAMIAITTVAMTQAMLIVNRNAAVTRVRNLAKAMVLSRIQEVGAVAYDPAASPAVIPTILAPGVTNEAVNLGDASTQLGLLPANLQWTVAAVGATGTRSVTARLTYTYMSRPQSYEVLTFRSPD